MTWYPEGKSFNDENLTQMLYLIFSQYFPCEILKVGSANHIFFKQLLEKFIRIRNSHSFNLNCFPVSLSIMTKVLFQKLLI